MYYSKESERTVFLGSILNYLGDQNWKEVYEAKGGTINFTMRLIWTSRWPGAGLAGYPGLKCMDGLYT